MCKPTVRYLLIATGAIAVCLAIYQVPFPPAVVVDYNNPNPEESPYRWYYFLSWWPVQTLNFIVGVGTVMHVLTSLVGLQGWRQWIVAIFTPTVWFTGWYSFSVRFLDYHPGSINEWGYIQGGLLGSSIGFGIVAFVAALPELLASASIDAAKVSTEPCDATEPGLHGSTNGKSTLPAR